MDIDTTNSAAAPEWAAASFAGAAEKPLRLRLAAAVQAGPDSRHADALQDFLDAEDTGEALSAWFGASGLRQLGDRRDDLRHRIDRDIAAIDRLLGDQVDAILHHADFKRMEASWRGVEYLLDGVEDEDRVKVRLFHATWSELSRDFDRAAEFDQSTLFNKVYSEEYGMPGGIPYGLLLCDYTVRHRYPAEAGVAYDDVSTLKGLAQVSAASFSPCIIGAAPELFGVGTFAELSHAQQIDVGFQLTEYNRWRRLQQHEDSRFLGVALPRILLRDKHRDSPSRPDGFRYSEGGTSIDDWLWGSAVYAVGAVTIRAFRDWGWFADIRGARQDREEAGVITGLPAPSFSTDEGCAYRRPLEVELTDKKQKVLEDLGFIALSPLGFTRSVVLLGAQSLHTPADLPGTAEGANAKLSAMLQYVLCVSRFAHYIKVMARDRIGAYTSAAELEKMLSDWLRNYMLGNPDASSELKARYPLAGGSVQVSEIAGRPGVLNCIVHIQPHFQFDQMVTGFRLRTEMQVAHAA